MNQTNSTVEISIGFSRHRIRIFKNTLVLLGNPKYIQLLVNPIQKVVAIRAVEKEMAGDQSHKTDRPANKRDLLEICSMSFINKLSLVTPDIDKSRTYRLTGRIDSNLNIAYFPLSTLTKIEG